MTSWLHAVEDSCELEICKKIRAAEIYLAEPEMPDSFVTDIESFLTTYPYENAYREQLEKKYLPAMKRLRSVKGDLADCLDSSITQRVLVGLGVKVKDFFTCQSCAEQEISPILDSSVSQIAQYMTGEKPSSESILIRDLANTSKKNAIDRFVELQYNNRNNYNSEDMATKICKKVPSSKREACQSHARTQIEMKLSNLNLVEENRSLRSHLQRKDQSEIEKEIINKANGYITKINGELDLITPTAIVAPKTAIASDSFLYEDHIGSPLSYKMLWDNEDREHFFKAKAYFTELSRALGILTVAPTISKEIVEILDEISSMNNISQNKWTNIYKLQSVRNRRDYPSDLLEVNAAYDYLETQAAKYEPELPAGTVVYPSNIRALSNTFPPSVYTVRVKKRISAIASSKGDNALDDVEKAIQKELKKADALNAENLHKAVLYNPLALAEVLMDNPGLAPYVCSYVHKAEEEREKQEKIANAIYITSAITGILSIPAALLTGGTSAVVFKAISAGLAVASGVMATTMGTVEAVAAHNEMEQIRAALASGNTGIDDISMLNETRDEFNSFVMWAIADAGMTAFDVVQLMRSVKSLRQLKQVMVQQDEVADLVRNLKNSSSPEEQAHFWMEVKKKNLFDKILALPQDEIDDLFRTCRRI